jgi:hypothetical protein
VYHIHLGRSGFCHSVRHDGESATCLREVIPLSTNDCARWTYHRSGWGHAAGENAPGFLGHSEGTPGYHSFAFHEPGRDITIVIFGSSTLLTARGGQRLDKFYKTLRNELFE